MTNKRPGPVAMVTGGARRVGRAIALTLARSGFDIVVTYKSSAEEAESLAHEIESLGGECEPVRVALDDPASAERAAAELASRLERLDALVHNASIYSPTPIDELTAHAARRHHDINALSPLLLTKALAPLLARSSRPGGGSVVAMVDIHAMGRPRLGFSAYAMSKAALHEMVRSLARELAPDIRVNGVAPGVVAWPETGCESDRGSQAQYIKRVPMGREGTPEDAAEAVRWLIMDATYCTGEIIRVDGGRALA